MAEFNLNDIFKAYQKEKEMKFYNDKNKKNKLSLLSKTKLNREEINNQRLAIRKFGHVKK